MEQNSEKRSCVVVTRDYVRKCVTIEKKERDSGLTIGEIILTKNEFLNLKELIKDAEI